MRDSLFPTIWAEHKEAQFNAVMVREQLITTIEGAPGEWSTRLVELGFRKGSRAWMRLNGLTPSEYEYLSPTIVLKPFQFDEVLNAHGDAPGNLVPLTVQDEIAVLWQKNLDAVLFELSFHGVATKSEAWTHVEGALAGDATLEAGTVLELAFTKMNHEGRLIGTALDYAALKGWKGAEIEPAVNPGIILLGSGSSIRWKNAEGVLLSGRLAMPLRDQDDFAWLYEDGPQFIGGISATPLVQVPRHDVQIDGKQESVISTGDDTRLYLNLKALVEDDAVANPAAGFQIALSGYDARVVEAAIQFLSTGIITFPEHGWRRGLKELTQAHQHLADLEIQIYEFLTEVESNLQALSTQYYGPIGVGFCILRQQHPLSDVRTVSLCIGRYTSDGFYSIADSVGPVVVSVDNILDFDGACEALDSDLRQAILAFSEDAMRLGQALGVQHAVPASFYESYRVAKAVSAIAASGRDLSMDQLLTVLTVSNGRGDMVKDLLHGDIKASGHKIELYNREIPFDVDSQHSTQNPTLRLAVQSGSVSLIDLEDARSAITTSPRSVLAKAEVILSFATAEMMSNLNSELLDVAALQPGITTLAHHKRQIAPHLNQDDATGAMGAFIEKLAIVLGDDSMQPLFAARHLLERFPLVERFHRAVEATAKADQTRLESWVRDELNKSYRGEIPRVSYDVLDREVYRITDEIRGNQGVAIVVSSGASGTKFKLRGVIPTDSAITESREAVLGGAAVLVKDQLRLRGQTIIIDAIAFSDPELCALLAGGGDGVQKTSRIVNAYEDTTVVVGIVAEDLRDLSNVDLVTQALNMSADQKARFLKRELIWPRMSYEEMKARGLLLQTAIALDTLWKGLPKTPKSPSAKHVRGFVQLLTMMREGCAQIVERIRLGELPDCPFGDAHYGGAKSRLDAEFRKVTHDACFSDAVRGAYQLRDFKVDGITGVSLCDYEPFSPHAPAMAQIMSTATWNGYLKERKIARSVHGSPVTRDGVITKGANYRKGISVNAADFLRTFGFCGVEYGNWTNQLEREKHLNFAYDSLMDIARAVGWEPMALSLGGRLRLCIGPRLGATNTGVAHSDPLNSAVNLTQLSGDGAVAHEYFHAIASHFGHIHTGRTDDISKAFAYGFQKPGQLPTLSNTPFREPVGSAFHNLQVAITRKPRPGGDPCNIDDYVDLSDMMVASNELGPAWAAPAEMFARAMELWLSAQLHTQGHRNERIVRWGGGVSVYPDENHLSRIKQWISPLLEAIQLEVSRVVHPTLGELAMPALNSENRSALALTHQDLIELATNELQGLFDEAASQPLLYSNEDVKSGYYNAVEHVLGLNDMYADHETFYHEAWRACESKLLTPSERGTLICLFAKNGSLAETVLQAMGDTGLSELAVSAATESSQELQAYAFQMWAVGKFDLADSISGFYRVKSFVDGVSEVAGLLGGEGVVSALRRFEEVSLSRGLEPVNGLADSYGVALHISVNRDEVLEGDRFQPLNSMRM